MRSNLAELPPVITIDGPSGVGKGAVSAALAKDLGWHLLDSGAVYRALALYAYRLGIDSADETGLVTAAAQMDLNFLASSAGISVLINGEPVDEALRSEPVSQMASKVAAIPAVRAALLAMQYQLRQSPGLIADGRDMGTVVFPDAKAKIFLTASPRERALRRFKQLKDKGEDVIFDGLFRDITERDKRDRERAVSPTVPADDALVIDSTGMALEEVITKSKAFVAERIAVDSRQDGRD